ncbi:MAG: hypothetical protein WC029_02830 [Sulfuricella sp.]|jgi:chromosome segregation ATPase
MVLRLLRHGAVVAFLAVSWLPDAMAGNNKESKDRQALRRVQVQLNEVRQQKSSLEQEKSVLAGQVEEMKKKSLGLESGAARANARLTTLDKKMEGMNKDKDELSDKLQKSASELQEMTKKQAEAMQTLQRKDQEIVRLETAVSRQTRQVEACETKNTRLHQLNVELMDKYQSKGIFGALLQAEPFTQMKSVEAENLLQDYRDRRDEEKFTPVQNPR